MTGRVVSTKSLKTVTVLVESVAKHPLYKKTYMQSKKYLVDDPIGVRIGDIVDFTTCKPVSKRKYWRVTKVLGKNFTEIAKDQLKKSAEEIISEVMPEEPTSAEASVSKKEEVVTDNSAEKPKSKKKGRTELSK